MNAPPSKERKKFNQKQYQCINISVKTVTGNGDYKDKTHSMGMSNKQQKLKQTYSQKHHSVAIN